MSARIYHRELRLTLARGIEGNYFAEQPNAVRIAGGTGTGLRVTFNIERTLEKEPNTCEIVVYNLAERTRAEFVHKPLRVALDVGYDGRLEQLFIGDLHYANTEREGADMVTRLQVADGARAISEARVSTSFSAVDGMTALSSVAATMGLEPHVQPVAAAALGAQLYTTGLVLHGPSRDGLSRILDPLGLRWSIQDGDLVVLGASEVRSTGPLLVTARTGMVGEPTFAAPESGTTKPILTVRSKILPSARPGELIAVQAAKVNGMYRAERVSHEGDSHGQVWQTTWEAKSA